MSARRSLNSWPVGVPGVSSMWSKIANLGVVTVRSLGLGAGAWVIPAPSAHCPAHSGHRVGSPAKPHPTVSGGPKTALSRTAKAAGLRLTLVLAGLARRGLAGARAGLA